MITAKEHPRIICLDGFKLYFLEILLIQNAENIAVANTAIIIKRAGALKKSRPGIWYNNWYGNGIPVSSTNIFNSGPRLKRTKKPQIMHQNWIKLCLQFQKMAKPDKTNEQNPK